MYADRASLKLSGLLDLRQSDEVIDRFRHVVEKALDAATSRGGTDDPRVMRDVIHVAGKQGGDGRRAGDLNQLHVKSFGAKEAPFAGGEQWQFLKSDGRKANPNGSLLGRAVVYKQDGDKKI